MAERASRAVAGARQHRLRARLEQHRPVDAAVGTGDGRPRLAGHRHRPARTWPIGRCAFGLRSARGQRHRATRARVEGAGKNQRAAVPVRQFVWRDQRAVRRTGLARRIAGHRGDVAVHHRRSGDPWRHRRDARRPCLRPARSRATQRAAWRRCRCGDRRSIEATRHRPAHGGRAPGGRAIGHLPAVPARRQGRDLPRRWLTAVGRINTASPHRRLARGVSRHAAGAAGLAGSAARRVVRCGGRKKRALPRFQRAAGTGRRHTRTVSPCCAPCPPWPA